MAQPQLQLLMRLLDPEDYRYIRAHDMRVEIRFRRRRMKIYGQALRAVARGAKESYHSRLANLSAAGAWDRYFGLLMSTGFSFAAIAKLWLAGMLFRFRLPVLVDLAAQRDRLERFLAVQAPSA